MKFINYLQSISGVGIFPLVSLLIFFAFFAVLIWYVYATDNSEILSMKNIPLDTNEDSNQPL